MRSQLTRTQRDVLALLANLDKPTTGEEIARLVYDRFTHPAGAHATAASLVRRGLADKVLKERPGMGRKVNYAITAEGRRLLERETK